MFRGSASVIQCKCHLPQARGSIPTLTPKEEFSACSGVDLNQIPAFLFLGCESLDGPFNCLGLTLLICFMKVITVPALQSCGSGPKKMTFIKHWWAQTEGCQLWLGCYSEWARSWGHRKQLWNRRHLWRALNFHRQGRVRWEDTACKQGWDGRLYSLFGN